PLHPAPPDLHSFPTRRSSDLPSLTPPYRHTPLFPLGADRTAYRKLSADGIRTERVLSRDMLVVSADALRALAEAAFTDINHLLRDRKSTRLNSSHLVISEEHT